MIPKDRTHKALLRAFMVVVALITAATSQADDTPMASASGASIDSQRLALHNIQ